VGRSKVELWGRALARPELRTTPGGTALLRLAIDCGGAGENLRLEVVMTGEPAREAAARLETGQALYVSGRLRAVRPTSRPALRTRPIEVLASEIKPMAG
jgi:single-stranded DNA-binding protein